MLPWKEDVQPLMLAPMQGLTNRGLRQLFIDRVRPDVVWTEYVRVQHRGTGVISRNDRLEIGPSAGLIPLVVQLIGSDTESMLQAVDIAQELGADHLNLNLGCPYGRMGRKAAGGALLKEPVRLGGMLQRLRPAITGSFSLKVRVGFDEPSELFALLPLFEDCGIDFLVVHARTVAQRYSGVANHALTAAVVQRTSLPVIANGDIFNAADGQRVLAETRASGLMLGRGAIADPLLFQRLRGAYGQSSSPEERRVELCSYLQELISIYKQLFCGEQQALSKWKEVLAFISDPELGSWVKELKKVKKITQLNLLLS